MSEGRAPSGACCPVTTRTTQTIPTRPRIETMQFTLMTSGTDVRSLKAFDAKRTERFRRRQRGR